MRKIALIAMLAIVAAMVPMTTASSQPTPGSLDGVGTLMIINDGSLGQVDLWLEIEDGEFQKLDLAAPSQTEFQVPKGTHPFRVCGESSTDENCTGDPLGSTPGSVVVNSNDIINFLITGSPVVGTDFVYHEENDTEQTETDDAKLTIFNSIPATVDVCVGDDHVISLPVGPSFQVAEFDGKDGETREVRIQVGAFLGCNVGDPSTELGFPPGSNTVINLTISATCTSDCGYQIFPGEEPPSTSQQVQEFCAVVLESANITPWLQELFAEVEVGNEDTYPDPEEVEKVLVRIAELLEKGNQTAPNDIRDAWLTATAAFVETGRLAAVDYDISALSQEDQRNLVLGIDNPREDDEEVAAAVAELTAWVTANCFGTTPVVAEPSFTG
jgi:hypothetical protein